MYSNSRAYTREYLQDLRNLEVFCGAFELYFTSELTQDTKDFITRAVNNPYRENLIDDFNILKNLLDRFLEESSHCDWKNLIGNSDDHLRNIKKNFSRSIQGSYTPTFLIVASERIDFILNGLDQNTLIYLRIDSLLDIHEWNEYPKFKYRLNSVFKNPDSPGSKDAYLKSLQKLIKIRTIRPLDLKEVSLIYKNIKRELTEEDYKAYDKFLKELIRLTEDLEVSFMLEYSSVKNSLWSVLSKNLKLWFERSKSDAYSQPN